MADDAYESYWREQPELKKKKNQAESALLALKKDPCEELAELLHENAQGLAESAKDMTKPLEERIAAQEAHITKISKAIETAPKIPPRAMIPVDSKTPSDEHIRLAGQFIDTANLFHAVL